MRRRRRDAVAAAAAPQPQQPHIPEVLPADGSSPAAHAVPDLVAGQQLWEDVEAAAEAAERLENSGRGEEAIEVLKQALARLEAAGGDDFAMVPLLQLLWDALHSAGRHREALLAIARVSAAVGARFGADSAETQLVSVRLGISSAACGQLEAGLNLIYGATPVLQHNLTNWRLHCTAPQLEHVNQVPRGELVLSESATES
ncbi:Nephrocystin [Micractinium conductrix]|uniref:Nephrocystin n=1 Tax=Micractinium conductrix TaxID=554055 RepID=A0A2P6V9W8_9CHLO|nr:Nephrocystin [Micractinium conductrix]|eukprot:PSC70889.1 Nephrocystin [Micractinium conductrix]